MTYMAEKKGQSNMRFPPETLAYIKEQAKEFQVPAYQYLTAGAILLASIPETLRQECVNASTAAKRGDLDGALVAARKAVEQWAQSVGQADSLVEGLQGDLQAVKGKTRHAHAGKR